MDIRGLLLAIGISFLVITIAGFGAYTTINVGQSPLTQKEMYSECLSKEVSRNTHMTISSEGNNSLNTLKIAKKICESIKPE